MSKLWWKVPGPKFFLWVAILTAVVLFTAADPFGWGKSSSLPTPAPVSDPLMNLRPSNPISVTVDPAVCNVRLTGVSSKKEGEICVVSIDRQAHPYVTAEGGKCTGINTTSPKNSATTLVIELKDETFALSFPSITTEEAWNNNIAFYPSLTVRGVGSSDMQDCLAQPTDPN